LPRINELLKEQVDDLKKRYASEPAHAFVGRALILKQDVTYHRLIYAKSLLHGLLSGAYPEHYTPEDTLVMHNFNPFEFLHLLLGG
jgi:hypothetical protein